jgi:hypothetical protein
MKERKDGGVRPETGYYDVCGARAHLDHLVAQGAAHPVRRAGAPNGGQQ